MNTKVEIDRNTPAAWLGLTKSEVSKWSLQRVVSAVEADPMTLPGATFEREVSEWVGRKIGRQPQPGFIFVPLDIQCRDLTASVAGAGGFLVAGVQTEITGASFATALRGNLVAEALGVERVGPLSGTFAMPRVVTPPAPTWHTTEGAQSPESQGVFAQVAATPKSVSGYFEVSGQLLRQATPAVFDSLVLGELARTIAHGVDAALINGSGASGQPTGVLSTSGTFAQSGTTLSFAGITNMIEAVEIAGLSNPARAGFVLGTGAAKLMRQRERAAGSGSILQAGQIDGFRAVPTKNCPSASIVFGDWSRAAIGEWGILEVGADPFTQFQKAIVGIRAIFSCDVLLHQPAAFAVSATVT